MRSDDKQCLKADDALQRAAAGPTHWMAYTSTPSIAYQDVAAGCIYFVNMDALRNFELATR